MTRTHRLTLERLEDRLAPAATQLVFSTSAFTVIAGKPSATVTVQLEDVGNNVAPAGAGGVVVNLSSTSTGPFFLDTSGNALASPSVFIAQGTSSASFKYEDIRLGTPTLTAAAAGLTSATQQETVTADLGVYNLNDDTSIGSLRYAIAHAVAGNTIAFAASVTGTLFVLTPLPALTISMNIVGPGSNLLTIDSNLAAASNGGVFAVKNGATVSITDLTVANANNTGVSNSGTLTLQRVVIQGNHASSAANAAPYGTAGGIYNDGTLTVLASTIHANVSGINLGAAGIDNELSAGGSSAVITDSAITGSSGTGIANNSTMTLNRVLVQGNAGSGLASFDASHGAPGGIYNGGTLTVLASTIDANTTTQSQVAAGIDSEAGSVAIQNSTISNNVATNSKSTGGIGIYGGTLVLSNSTVTLNASHDPSTTSGGGIDATGTSASIFDTIVAGNNTTGGNPTDVAGIFTSAGHNWIGKADNHSSGFGASDIVGTAQAPQDPKLASSIGNNGGPTPTFTLLPGSPAIDAGDNTNAPATDQRGLPRIAGGAIDIGAVEVQLLIGPASLPAAQVGAAYNQSLTASGGTAPYSFTLTAGALPAGLSLSTAGAITGTPTAGGTFSFTVMATDASAGTPRSGSKPYTLVVAPPVLSLSPAILPGAPVNAAYNQQITGAGGTAPYGSFTIASGQLPTGLTLSTTGVLSGTPTQVGVFTVTVSAADSSTGTGPFTVSQAISLFVTPAGFTYNSTTKVLAVIASAAQSTFNFAQTTTVDNVGALHTTYTFALNGATLAVPDTLLASATISATGANSTAILLTNDTYTVNGVPHETAELAALGPTGGQIQKNDAAGNAFTFLQLSGFPVIYAYVGRADSGLLLGKTQPGGENILVTAGAYSYVTGLGQYYEISGARSIYGYAANSTDQVWHYDTAALDAFVSSGNAFSYMSGTDAGQSFFNVGVGFDVSYGIATHGQSYAYLIDSAGNDVFVGSASYSYLSGNDAAGPLFNVAEGFVLVYSQSFVGGTDYAYNYAPTRNIIGGNWIRLA